MSTIKQYIAGKLLSGRFLLTIVTSICFAIIVIHVFQMLETKVEKLDPDKLLLFATNIFLVIQNVFTHYFTKTRNGNGSTNNENEDNNTNKTKKQVIINE